MNGKTHMVPLLLLALLVCGCDKKEEAQAPAYKFTPGFPEEPVGEALFNERCRQCHKVGELGGAVGPDLSQVGGKRDREFLERVIREPSAVFPGTVMPPSDTLSKKQVDSLVDYLGKQK